MDGMINYAIDVLNKKIKKSNGSNCEDMGTYVEIPFDEKIEEIKSFLIVTEHMDTYFNEQHDIGNNQTAQPEGPISIDNSINWVREVKMLHKMAKSFYLSNTSKMEFVKLMQRKSVKQRMAITLIHHTLYENDRFNLRVYDFHNLCWASYMLNGALLDVYHLKYSSNFNESFYSWCEIFCTRSYLQLTQIKQQYDHCCEKSLYSTLKSMTDANTAKLIIKMFETPRSISCVFDENDPVLNDYRLFTNPSYQNENMDKFIELLATRSYYEIRIMSARYLDISSISLIHVIETIGANDIKMCAKAILQYATYSYNYFAEQLVEYVKEGKGGSILRILLTRESFDLKNIMNLYLISDPDLSKLYDVFSTKPFIAKTIVDYFKQELL